MVLKSIALNKCFYSANRETIDFWIQEVGDVNHEDESDAIHQSGTALMWAAIYGKSQFDSYFSIRPIKS